MKKLITRIIETINSLYTKVVSSNEGMGIKNQVAIKYTLSDASPTYIGNIEYEDPRLTELFDLSERMVKTSTGLNLILENGNTITLCEFNPDENKKFDEKLESVSKTVREFQHSQSDIKNPDQTEILVLNKKQEVAYVIPFSSEP